MNRQAIDAGLVQETERLMKTYRWDASLPKLINEWRRINFTRPRPIDVRQFWSIIDRLGPFVQYHKRFPFASAPEEIISPGDLTLARQVINGAPIRATWRELSMHSLIASRSGAGKTTMAFRILEQAINSGIRTIIFDLKSDYLRLLAQDKNMLVLDRDAPLNLLQLPSFMRFPDFTANWVTTFSRGPLGRRTKKANSHRGY